VGLLSWILFGFVAGALARILAPGPHRIGCFGTIAVGVVGSLLGGLAGEVLLGDDVDFGWDIGPLALAVAGSIVLLLVLRALGGGRRRP